jgi:hypothetical protein
MLSKKGRLSSPNFVDGNFAGSPVGRGGREAPNVEIARNLVIPSPALKSPGLKGALSNGRTQD